MKAKDHFIEWLRDKILQNPAEPPAAAWQEIAESLDLEDSWEGIEEELELDAVWQKVDSRLQNYDHLLRFEKISQGLSLFALALLFLPLFYMPAQQEPIPGLLSREQDAIEQEKERSNPSAAKAEYMRSLSRDEEENVIDASSLNPAMGNEVDVSAAGQQEERNIGDQPVNRKLEDGTGLADIPGAINLRKQKGSLSWDNQEETALSYRAIIPAGPSIEPVWEELSVEMNVPIKTVKQSATRKIFDVYPTAYIGAGTAVKLSSLLSSKTWHAMERSSLLSSSPIRQQDIYVLYGQRLAQRLFLQADVYLQNKAGQQYQEYREGTYTSFRDELSYRSVALSVSWIRKQLGYGRVPIFARWTGGLYGGKLGSAEESSLLGEYTKTEEYSRFHAGLLAGYEYDLLLHPQLILSYGVFGRADVMNIYSGTELIPSSFRKTRAGSLDFRLTIRYTIKK